jgi:hypothetical protein
MKHLFKKKVKKGGIHRAKTATITFAKSTKFSKPVKNVKTKFFKGGSFGLNKYSKKTMSAKKYKKPKRSKFSCFNFKEKECST